MDIEKFENLPHKESNKHLMARHDRYRYNGHSDCHKVNGEFPWKHVERILNAYKGKPFDKAFTAYCAIVPDYQQKWFLEEFEEDIRNYSFSWEQWYVDGDGNIQVKRREKKKNPISFCSDDYKVELRHKITGHKKNDFEVTTVTKKITSYYHKSTTTYEYGTKWSKLLPKYQRYIAKEDDFEPVVVKGWIKYFKSKNDREFKRLSAEKLKKDKKKTPKKVLSDEEYRAILREKVLKDRALAKQKLEAKGMRPDAFTSHTNSK